MRRTDKVMRRALDEYGFSNFDLLSISNYSTVRATEADRIRRALFHRRANRDLRSIVIIIIIIIKTS